MKNQTKLGEDLIRVQALPAKVAKMKEKRCGINKDSVNGYLMGYRICRAIVLRLTEEDTFEYLIRVVRGHMAENWRRYRTLSRDSHQDKMFRLHLWQYFDDFLAENRAIYSKNRQAYCGR